MANDKDSKNDDLLRRIDRLTKNAKAASDAAGAVQNKTGLYGKLKTVFSAASAIYDGVVKYTGPFGAALKWAGGHMKDAFMWSAFEREGGDIQRNADGSLNFSGKRLGKVFAAAAAGVLALNIAGQAAYFYSTQFDELVYTTGKQELVEGEKYQFTGCTSLPCSTELDNGKHFKVETSLFFPRLINPDDDVYANIPMQDAACQVKGYGMHVREARFLIKKFDWWQHVYDVQCRPYTDAERETAIGSGEVTPPTSLKAPVPQHIQP
ncbi:MAG: hypothetical protein H6867_05070 [Rhodospirillales bacterium]|nr:hypothetical protein [Rhodospirillales bacterium]MCB9994899.1 hypothetical protein [Rhodospirillales bacterium]